MARKLPTQSSVSQLPWTGSAPKQMPSGGSAALSPPPGQTSQLGMGHSTSIPLDQQGPCVVYKLTTGDFGAL